MKKEKVDKGFELLYDNLSYRRKFIRILWTIPVGTALGIFLIFFEPITSIVFWLMFIPSVVKELKHNYTMWKQEENNSDDIYLNKN